MTFWFNNVKSFRWLSLLSYRQPWARSQWLLCYLQNKSSYPESSRKSWCNASTAISTISSWGSRNFKWIKCRSLLVLHLTKTSLKDTTISLASKSRLAMIKMLNENTSQGRESCRSMQRLSKLSIAKLSRWRDHTSVTMSIKCSTRWAMSSNSSNMKHLSSQQRHRKNLWALFTNIAANWLLGHSLLSLRLWQRNSVAWTTLTTKKWLLLSVYSPTTIEWKREWHSSVLGPMLQISTIETSQELRSETGKIWFSFQKFYWQLISILRMPATI